MKEDDILKTGTTTVGIVCKDCVILAADKRATAGNFIAMKHVDKVVPVNNRMAVTTAGSVSDLQLIIKLLKAELNLKTIRVDRDITVTEAANLLGNIVYNNIRKMSMIPGVTHFLLGGVDTKSKLYDLYADGSITEVDDFVGSGSGSVIAYGVLESSYKTDMSEEEGVELALKSINAALQRDSASGGGIDVYVINKDGVKNVAHKKVNSKAV
ncbi:MAG: proteasome subunit beta [Nanoarchaeota archaeon]|nr:proteasome subunit beta [Nanoarchaeota archaeon]MBU1321155.1 proteasome subunit beta [Nanoarchaeota archaeon]MBU1597484.1 proteasome subunit beta [Nanoarchaeota archaeon]MBU2441858.1 proteasome subunit beta [Nanoarchaeota archaeon]